MINDVMPYTMKFSLGLEIYIQFIKVIVGTFHQEHYVFAGRNLWKQRNTIINRLYLYKNQCRINVALFYRTQLFVRNDISHDTGNERTY